MIIPPASDMEAMAKFLDEHPGWSPVLNDSGVQIGVASPGFGVHGWIPTESGDGA